MYKIGTAVVHNTAQNSSDNLPFFPLYLPDNHHNYLLEMTGRGSRVKHAQKIALLIGYGSDDAGVVNTTSVHRPNHKYCVRRPAASRGSSLGLEAVLICYF